MFSYLKNAVWVEKYRPLDLDGLVLPKEYVTKFKEFVAERHFPNLLFYGDVGSGKTTVGLILCKIGSAVLELNSSDDRGINVMRNKIKPFVFTHSEGLRVVFLDEFDGATLDAQRALRRLMEQGVGNARFILTANHIHRIIPALRSRCVCFEFTPPSKEYVCEYLEEILEKEEIELDEEDLDMLIDDCYPDIRKCVHTLQLNCHGGKLAYSFIQAGGGGLDFGLLFEGIKNQDIKGIREVVIDENPNYDFIYKELLNIILQDEDFEDAQPEALLAIAEYAYRDSMVVDRELNFSACCVELGTLLGEEK